MSAKQKKYFAKKGTKKKPVLGVDYGTGTVMYGPQRKRGRKAKLKVLGVDYGTGTVMYGPHRKRGRKVKGGMTKAQLAAADKLATANMGNYTAISDRKQYTHKGGVKLYKGRKLAKGRKKPKFNGPTTKQGFPLNLFKTNLGKMVRKAKENGIPIPR